MTFHDGIAKEVTLMVISQFFTDRAPEPDKTPHEIYKLGSESIIEKLCSLFLDFWEKGCTLRMLILLTCIRGSMRGLSVIMTEACLSSELLEIFGLDLIQQNGQPSSGQRGI